MEIVRIGTDGRVALPNDVRGSLHIGMRRPSQTALTLSIIRLFFIK